MLLVRVYGFVGDGERIWESKKVDNENVADRRYLRFGVKKGDSGSDLN